MKTEILIRDAVLAAERSTGDYGSELMAMYAISLATIAIAQELKRANDWKEAEYAAKEAKGLDYGS